MAKFRREKCGRYILVYRGKCTDIAAFISKAMDPDRRLTAGRGAPGLFEFSGENFICRQYLHGGWLRGITKGAFMGEKRASDELDITTYLEEHGFPVVEAFGYISQKGIIANDLFFVSVFVDNARDLVEYFKSSHKRDRLRMSRKLAIYFFMLGDLGIYHPDLHLKNVLVDPAAQLCFLDFDKAYRKQIVLDDYEKMFWRLDRYVRKYSGLFGNPVDDRERLIFLRTFERLSGQKIISGMQENRVKKERSARFGWLIDRILYNRKKR
ncbi:MAG: Mn2+dependent serine/threonine protein kinase [Deltaproteobacteria bacterium]|nr:Mn2+dependent serine/threonine protein kinase [Deltaproteobacteria bacterium]